MAKPKKDPEKLRIHRLQIPVTSGERDLVQDAASDFSSVSEFVRQAVMGKAVQELARSGRMETKSVDLDEWAEKQRETAVRYKELVENEELLRMLDRIILARDERD